MKCQTIGVAVEVGPLDLHRHLVWSWIMYAHPVSSSTPKPLIHWSIKYASVAILNISNYLTLRQRVPKIHYCLKEEILTHLSFKRPLFYIYVPLIMTVWQVKTSQYLHRTLYVWTRLCLIILDFKENIQDVSLLSVGQLSHYWILTQ